MDKATELLKRIQPYLNDWDFPLGLTDDVNAFLLSGDHSILADWEVDADSVSALDLYSLGDSNE
jgi:hypothetical protein